jgi:hypothetical protein
MYSLVIKGFGPSNIGSLVCAKFPPSFTEPLGLSPPKYEYELYNTPIKGLMTLTFTMTNSLSSLQRWDLMNRIIKQLALEKSSMSCEYRGCGSEISGRMC